MVETCTPLTARPLVPHRVEVLGEVPVPVVGDGPRVVTIGGLGITHTCVTEEPVAAGNLQGFRREDEASAGAI